MPYKDPAVQAAYQKRYRETHPEQAKAASRKWLAANPGYNKAYHDSHKAERYEADIAREVRYQAAKDRNVFVGDCFR